MKYIMLFSMLFASSVLADVGGEIAPDPTKKGEVVELVGKDGHVTKFDHENYAIVPRIKRAPKVCPPQVECHQPWNEKIILVRPDPKNNKVKLYGGVGPRVYEAEVFSGALHISQGYELVVGLGYERRLDDDWSLEAVGLTNRTGLLGVGYSF